MLVLASNALSSQTRISLLEEFTGENCAPCASYNPALDSLLATPQVASKMVAIKWEVPIPTAPYNPPSIYVANKPEIDWRYGPSASGYGYQAMYTPTSSPFDGILNAPTCFIDGQNQWTFGAASDHPFYLTNTVVNTAASVPTPFSINLATSWNNSFSNCMVTVTVACSSLFTTNGDLKLRLCLIERYIQFPLAPGTNGETIFHNVVRQSYPTTSSPGGAITSMGSALPSNWTAGQTQTLSINCAIPGSIVDSSQLAFVAFVQDDGDKKVWQTKLSSQPGTGVLTGFKDLLKNELSLNLYPNPAGATAFLSVNTEQIGFLLVEMENSLGQIVYSRNQELFAGPNTVSLDCKNLANGIYLVRVRSGEQVTIRKLMISK